MRRRVGLALCATLIAGSSQACSIPAHQSTQMPDTVVLEEFDGDFSPIWGAWYDGPTQVYDHGILGDATEATNLVAYSDQSLNSCNVIGVSLDASHVFEDVAPRLVDLDGDGRAEIITVRTHLQLGAQIAIYGDAMDHETLTLIATTPYIGRTHRWLAPIGAADLDGDGMIEIAYIDRPHLAKTLMVWRFVPDGSGGGMLEQVASLDGLTNHRIGEPTISGGIRDCGAGPEMITADANWSHLHATRLSGGQLSSEDIGRYSANAMTAALRC
ncbi:MAG: hypothetical protein ACI8TF_001109 [Paracoccaceae bacterium]|jgi:hypothetical protein